MSKTDQEVASETRTALVAGTGVILGFALNFVGQWSLGDSEWHPAHLVPGLLLASGILFLLRALMIELRPNPTDSSNRHAGRVLVMAVIALLVGLLASMLASACIQ